MSITFHLLKGWKRAHIKKNISKVPYRSDSKVFLIISIQSRQRSLFLYTVNYQVQVKCSNVIRSSRRSRQPGLGTRGAATQRSDRPKTVSARILKSADSLIFSPHAATMELNIKHIIYRAVETLDRQWMDIKLCSEYETSDKL